MCVARREKPSPQSPFLRKGGKAGDPRREEKRWYVAACSSPPSERRGSRAAGTRGDAGAKRKVSCCASLCSAPPSAEKTRKARDRHSFERFHGHAVAKLTKPTIARMAGSQRC